MTAPLIISLGGSLIYPQEIDVSYLKQFRTLILDAVKKEKRFGIVCGGGFIAREYIKKANEVVSLAPVQNDFIGIACTRANSQLIRELFGDIAYHDVIVDYSKKIEIRKSIIIGAGWKPGCSTDHDAVLLAMNTGSKIVVNLTNVDYVYDKDPRKYPNAQPLKNVSWSEFKVIISGEWKAGMNLPFDPIASALAEKEQMQVIILNGEKLDNFQRFLAGKDFVGTVIR